MSSKGCSAWTSTSTVGPRSDGGGALDAEFADLIPLFVEEARDRLERLASSVPKLEVDPQSVVEAKRELHTLKGAGRMMRIGALAELCHAAEEVLHAARPGMIPLLTRVVDELTSLVESVSRGEEPPVDAELVGLLHASVAEPPAPEPKPEIIEPAPEPEPPPVPNVKPVPAPAPAAPEPAAQTSAKSSSSAGGDVRVDTAALDAVAERATQVRVMAVAGRAGDAPPLPPPPPAAGRPP